MNLFLVILYSTNTFLKCFEEDLLKLLKQRFVFQRMSYRVVSRHSCILNYTIKAKSGAQKRKQKRDRYEHQDFGDADDFSEDIAQKS